MNKENPFSRLLSLNPFFQVVWAQNLSPVQFEGGRWVLGPQALLHWPPTLHTVPPCTKRPCIGQHSLAHFRLGFCARQHLFQGHQSSAPHTAMPLVEFLWRNNPHTLQLNRSSSLTSSVRSSSCYNTLVWSHFYTEVVRKGIVSEERKSFKIMFDKHCLLNQQI